MKHLEIKLTPSIIGWTVILIYSLISGVVAFIKRPEQVSAIWIPGLVIGSLALIVLFLICCFFIAGLLAGDLDAKEWTIKIPIKGNSEKDLLYEQLGVACIKKDEEEQERILIELEKLK